MFVDAIYFILCHNWKNDLYQCIALNFYEMYLEVNSLTVRPLITVITVVFNSVNTSIGSIPAFSARVVGMNSSAFANSSTASLSLPLIVDANSLNFFNRS